MSLDQNLNKILIIDFGSQFTQLIARRVRELGVFSEIVSHKKIKLKDINHSIKGIVLSGGPLNVYQINKYSFDKKILQLDVPVLGICFGHQILSKLNGGRVKQSKHREFGLANVYKKNNSLLTTNFFGNKKSKQVWMSHADQVSKLPKNFKVVASSTNSKFAIVENKIKKYYGVQFHPEVTHTENGKKIISNFIFLICKLKKIDWFSSSWDNESQKQMRKYNFPFNKVASAMLTNLKLLEVIARERKVTFISKNSCKIGAIFCKNSIGSEKLKFEKSETDSYSHLVASQCFL